MNAATAVISVTVVGAVFVGSGAAASFRETQLWNEQSQQNALTARELSKAEHVYEHSIVNISAEIETMRATITVRESALAQRPAFDAAISTAHAALRSAAGKVDVHKQKREILAAQHAALSADDAAAIKAATAAVSASVSTIRARVAEWERAAAERARLQATAQQARVQGTVTVSRSPGSSWVDAAAAPTRSTSWLSRVRSILNSVGGAGVPLRQYNGSCGGVRAIACSYPSGYIAVSSALANKSSSYVKWAMAHELAHQYQFRVWRTLNASKTYKTLFRSNIELLANCMAYAKGAPRYGHACSSAQITWAAGIWRGTVRN